VPRVLLLIPSTSYRARDFLAAAAALGVEVVVGSDHRQVLAAFSGGRTLHVDLAHPERAVAACIAHARRHPIDAVLGTDDETALLAAHAARALGLRHAPPRSVAAARDKHAFREALHAAGIAGPRFRLLDLRADLEAAIEAVRFPCVVKPRSLSASRGVLRADHAGALLAACRRIGSLLARTAHLAAPEHRHTLLVEDYLPGTEVALEGLLHDGRLQVLALLDKPDPMPGPCFEETLLVTPSRLPAHVQHAVTGATAAACRALGLDHGPVHAELRVDGARATLIELAPRSIGGLCSRALRFRGSTTLEALVLHAALGRPPLPVEPRWPASGVLMLPVREAGRLRDVAGVEQARALDGVEDVVIDVVPGDELEPLPEGGRYPGFVFARGDSPAQVERVLREAGARIRLRLSHGEDARGAAAPPPARSPGRHGPGQRSAGSSRA